MIESREKKLVFAESALLVVDMQNYCANTGGGEFSDLSEAEMQNFDYFFSRLPSVINNIQQLQAACRSNNIEVMYCVIESQTKDGRDRGLDYKITGFHVAKGSWDSEVIEPLKPGDDEIVISKTSSSVFNSTNIDYLLRALGIRQLVVCGAASDQCVEGAVRDACDLGYLVSLIPDACATYSDERQLASEAALAGYCRKISTHELVSEIRHTSGETCD